MGCVVFLGIFLTISYSWAANADPGDLEVSVQASSLEQLLNLRIPADWGIIKDSYNSGTDKLIINIQDAHCDFEAQQNIAKILDNLALNYKLKVVALEGASGEVKNALLSNFPDKKVRENVALYLVKQGTLTGAEYFAVNSDYDLKLYGVEDLRLYMDNLYVFQESQPFKQEAKGYFTSIRNALDMLKQQIYNENLKKLDLLENAYASRKTSFDKYAVELYKMIEENGLRRVNYPLFYELQNAIDLELNVDFKKADTERMQLITVLTQLINDKQTITNLVEKSLDFKKGMVSAGEFANYLKDLAFDLKLNMGAYPNFNAYAEYITKYEQVANENLFVEIKVITQALKNRFYDNDDQKQLDVLYKHLDVLTKLVDLKMDNDDIAYFFKNRGQINSNSFSEFIEPQAYKYKVVASLSPAIAYIDVYIPDWAKFYELADTRDAAFITKTLAHMDKDKADCAALITGGFHTKQLTEILKKKRISYMVIAPKASVNSENPYLNIIQGGQSDIENFLTQMQSTLAITIPTEEATADAGLTSSEAKTFEANFQKAEAKTTVLLAVAKFGAIAAADPGKSDPQIRTEVLEEFKVEAASGKVEVDLGLIESSLKLMSKKGDGPGNTTVLVEFKAGDETLVLDPKIALASAGNMTFSSDANPTAGVALAAVPTANNAADIKSTENSNVSLASPSVKITLADVSATVSSPSAKPDEKSVRTASIITQVVPSLAKGNAAVESIAADLKTNQPEISNVASLEPEIKAVVAKIEALILGKSSSAEKTAVIAVGAQGLDLDSAEQQVAKPIIQEALTDSATIQGQNQGENTVIDSISSQLADKAIIVSDLELSEALNTGLSGSYNTSTNSGAIIAQVVVSKLNLQGDIKTEVTSIIKNNAADAKTMTKELTTALKDNGSDIEETQVADALFAGFKQAAVAANPIASSSSSLAKVETNAQESFISSKIKASSIMPVLSKANAATNQQIVLTGDDRDALVLGVAAQAGVKSDAVDALVIVPGDYSSETENISVAIKPIGSGHVFIEVSSKKAEASSSPRIVVSEEMQAETKIASLVVKTLNSALDKHLESANLDNQADSTLENAKEDSAPNQKGRNAIFIPMSMEFEIDQEKSTDDQIVLTRKGVISDSMLDDASEHSAVMFYDDFFAGKQTISAADFAQAAGITNEKIGFIDPIDLAAAEGDFTAKIASASGLVKVVQQREGKLDNVCIIASNKSKVKGEADKLAANEDIDMKLTVVSYPEPAKNQLINGNIPIAQAVHNIYNGTDGLSQDSRKQSLAVIKNALTADQKVLITIEGDDLASFVDSFKGSEMSIEDLDIKNVQVYCKAITFA